MVHQRKWYVVVVGTEPGVYSSWIEAGPKTRNIPGGSIHQSFFSEDEAIRMFEAAKERGEVKAYPSAGCKDASSCESKNAPLSPLGEEAAWLRTPLDLAEDDAKSIELRMPELSSPARSRVAQLRRTLRDPTDSCSTPSSPPTDVTQAYAPLYVDDDVPCDTPEGRPTPNFTFTSCSSRAYPDISDELSSESDTEKTPPSPKIDVSDWGSPPFSDSHPGAEEHTSRPPRCMPLHPESRPKSKGVEYLSLTDLADSESIDPRIWLPESRVFDPDKVKPRPLTRPSSPAKKDTPSRYKTVDDTRCHISLVDTPFVRCDRGRPSRLAPSWSLPIFSNRELEDNRSGFGLQSTRLLENLSMGKTKGMDYSMRDKHLAERPTEYASSPRNYGRSHVQLVPRDGKDQQSAITVHCPSNCPHETCYRRPLTLSVSSIQPSRSTSSRYVDACVSPIIAIASRIQDDDSPAKIHLGEDHPCELAGFHVSHKAVAPEADVRSPITKGTMIPMNAAEMGRIRWKTASRARWLACLTGLSTLSDLACFLVALVVTVLTHVFWAL